MEIIDFINFDNVDNTPNIIVEKTDECRERYIFTWIPLILEDRWSWLSTVKILECRYIIKKKVRNEFNHTWWWNTRSEWLKEKILD